MARAGRDAAPGRRSPGAAGMTQAMAMAMAMTVPGAAAAAPVSMRCCPACTPPLGAPGGARRRRRGGRRRGGWRDRPRCRRHLRPHPCRRRGSVAKRVGWLEVDLGVLFDERRVPRRATVVGAVSRFPSSDIDLAFVVGDAHPADAVATRCAAPRETCSNRYASSTSTAARGSTKARAASPTGCASARPSAR